MKTTLSLLVSLCLMGNWVLAQSNYNEGPVIFYHIGYGLQTPQGDLADRFGPNFNLNNGVEFMTSNNWIFGLDGQILFGNEVKTDVLAPLRSPEGFIFADNNQAADIQLRERGMYLGLTVGKLIPLSKQNKRFGLRTMVGGGLLQHRIRIQEDPQGFVIQLTGDYKKGYDQLSNGFALYEFIGIQLNSINRRINFYAGFEFIQGFTENRRDVNFFAEEQETTPRLDLLLGFKLGWMLPFYLDFSPEEIRY